MAMSCCTALATCPGLAVALPNTTAFAQIEASYWSLQEAELTPSCIVSPHTSQHAADAVTILISHQACSGTDFAIKGRTHAPAAGFANIDGGVTIDMAGLSTVSTNADHTIAYVNAGASWLDVYSYLDPLGKSVAGGRNGAVGVGGLTVGGGISYFSPQVGFTCDTVINFELVIASGRLVHANATDNADLFRALKGGTNNFGLVTRIDYRTVPISKILGGSLAYSVDDRTAFFEAVAGIAGAPDYDVHASIVASIIFNSTAKSWGLISTPIYTLPETRPKVYEPLFAVPNISDTLHITKLSTFANETASPPLNWEFWTGTYGVSATLLNEIFDIINSTVYDFEAGGVVWATAFEPLPTVILSHGARNNSLGTSPADGNGFIMLISPLWTDSSSSGAVHAKAAEVLRKVNKRAKEMGFLKDFIYANYADASQRPLEAYGHRNVEFLQKVVQSYDPEGRWRRKVPGGFKIPSS